MNNTRLLICSCINVFAPSRINDPIIRREQYRSALIYAIKNYGFEKIIVVENSNSPWLSSDIMNMANNQRIELIELTFKADIEKTKTHSIGYAHFEMVNYAFQHGSLLQDADSLWVMDGRHMIENLNNILRSHSNGDCAFIPEVHRLKRNGLCDLRLYLVTKHVFNTFIWARRHELGLNRSEWAESLLDKILKERQFRFSSFTKLPRFIGIQGSTGVPWDGNNWLKYHIKRILVSLTGRLKY